MLGYGVVHRPKGPISGSLSGVGEVPEKLEPPIGFELMAYGLRNPRCTQRFQEVRVPNDQSCPLERIEQLIDELRKLAKCCPTCAKRPTGN